MLVGFEAPNKIQPREYSRGGGKDGIRHINLGREREPRQRRLEPQRQLGDEPEQVEYRQPGLLSLLFSFPVLSRKGLGFCY